MIRRPPKSTRTDTLFPYTTIFRSAIREDVETKFARLGRHFDQPLDVRTLLSVVKTEQRAEATVNFTGHTLHAETNGVDVYAAIDLLTDKLDRLLVDRKSTRLNSSH